MKLKQEQFTVDLKKYCFKCRIFSLFRYYTYPCQILTIIFTLKILFHCTHCKPFFNLKSPVGRAINFCTYKFTTILLWEKLLLVSEFNSFNWRLGHPATSWLLITDKTAVDKIMQKNGQPTGRVKGTKPFEENSTTNLQHWSETESR